MSALPLRVDVSLPLAGILGALHGKPQWAKEPKITGVALDTRAVTPGDLFFALKATRDGHDFVADAFKKGAEAAVVHRDVGAKGALVRVEDTAEALKRLAGHARTAWGKPVVAVCGSNGKTTTKEMTAAVLRTARNVHKTPGNWNNALGMPLTLLLLRPEHDAAVLELGINGFGEMTDLCRVARPDVGLLTNIGPEHLEKFGSIDGVAKAEGELFGALPPGGTAVLNVDDPHIRALGAGFSLRKVTVSLKSEADVTASVVKDRGTEGLTLRVKYGRDEAEIRLPFLGIHNVYNFLCALGAGLALGVPVCGLQAAADSVERPDMRLETLRLARNIRIVNDCYNANPASMTVALEVVKTVAPRRYIGVLGDMLELGDWSARAHRDIGIRAAGHGYAYLFLLGRFAGDTLQGAIQGGMKEERIRVFKTHDELVTALLEVVETDDTVLVKGSRGMRMEGITEGLRKALGEGDA